MLPSIGKVGIIGAGVMGSRIAGICTMAGNQVVLLDQSKERAQQAVSALIESRHPIINEDAKNRIHCGDIEQDIQLLADCDWICESVYENLESKRELFEKIAAVRKDNAIVTTNTSGIPLRDILQGFPQSLTEYVAVTHFFNPPNIMHLVELVPSDNTKPEVIDNLISYCGNTLGKGIVRAKDTVNFIANRIGCFFILAGLHQAKVALEQGVSIEEIDAALGEPLGLPKTGLYGLTDLIGLDVMHLVGENLKARLTAEDAGFRYTDLPKTEQAMFKAGQLGRKSNGGFYRLIRHEDGSKTKESYDLQTQLWRPSQPAVLDAQHTSRASLLSADTPLGKFSWSLMRDVLCYAADLIPEISDSIMDVDCAMRWGFNWKYGPFQLLDQIGCDHFIARLKEENRAVPKLLVTLTENGHNRLYRFGDSEYFSPAGYYVQNKTRQPN